MCFRAPSNAPETRGNLRIYLHEEGLCRLATEPYSAEASSFGNRFMHLTNYSINRRSSRYEPGTTGYVDWYPLPSTRCPSTIVDAALNIDGWVVFA